MNREFLEKEKENLETQRLNAIASAQQAVGAIAFCEFLISTFQDAIPIDDLAEAIGGPGATSNITPIDKKRGKA